MTQETTAGANGSKEPEQGDAIKAPNAFTITREEILEAENISLRLMNLSHQEAELRRSLGELQTRKMEKQQELLAFRKNLAEKYEIDFEHYEVEATTGKIVKKG